MKKTKKTDRWLSYNSSETEEEKDRAVWLTVTESEGYGRRFWRTPSAPPCNKGEIGIRLFGRKIVLGWGDGAPEIFDDGSEFCEACGVVYSAIWLTEDAIWREVTGEDEGMLCPRCFDGMADEAGILLYWECGQDQYRTMQDDPAPLVYPTPAPEEAPTPAAETMTWPEWVVVFEGERGTYILSQIPWIESVMKGCGPDDQIARETALRLLACCEETPRQATPAPEEGPCGE